MVAAGALLPAELCAKRLRGLIIGLLLVLGPNFSYGQTAPARPDSTGLFIPKDDASSYELPIIHLWVGDTTRLLTRQSGDLLTLTASNGWGHIDPADSALCWLVPARAGRVLVRTTERIRLGTGRFRIVSTVDTFVAIPQPKLRLVIDQQALKRREVSFHVVYDQTGQSALDRYDFGRLPQDIYILNPRRRRVSVISIFSPRINYRPHLRPGNVLQIPAMAIRDQQTDLLLSIPSFEYLIR